MARRSEHADQVGEWILRRRTELGWSQQQLADQVGASLRAVGGVERGETAVALRSRPAWERALGWSPGALTAAYRRGEEPGKVVELAPHLRLLRAAGVPDRYLDHPDVLDIVRADLVDREKVSLLRLWYAQRETFERLFESARTGDDRAETGR